MCICRNLWVSYWKWTGDWQVPGNTHKSSYSCLPPCHGQHSVTDFYHCFSFLWNPTTIWVTNWKLFLKMRGFLPRKKSISQLTVDAIFVGSLSPDLNLTKGRHFFLDSVMIVSLCNILCILSEPMWIILFGFTDHEKFSNVNVNIYMKDFIDLVGKE